MKRVLMGFTNMSGSTQFVGKLLKGWWAWQNSNLRPLPCQGRTGQSLTATSTDSKELIVSQSGCSGFPEAALGSSGF